jgi:hypothetical protein
LPFAAGFGNDAASTVHRFVRMNPIDPPSPSPTPERILQYAWGYAPTLIIEAAVQNRLFDSLQEGPLTLEELVERSGASSRGVRALADALIGLELLARDEGRYALTEESATFLVSSSPASLGPLFGHMGRQLIPSWLELPEVARTGKPATHVNRKDEGAEFFAGFVESLFPLSYAAARTLGEYLEVSKATGMLSVLDLGAGSGVWGIALAQQSTHVRIRAVDWPNVLPITQKVAKRFGVADRLTTVAGDLQVADFGVGHHIATIGHILHSEGVDRSRALLKRTFDSLAPGGTVAIMEFVVSDDRNGPPNALLFAVNMLVHTESGDAYTFPEMAGWLEEAGFVDARLLPSPGPSPLILATKPA